MPETEANTEDLQKQLEEIQNKIALNKATAELVESEKALAAKIKENAEAEDEKAKLEKQKQLIDAQIALSEAKKTQITSMLPKGQSQGAEGQITTTDNFGYTTELIAYKLVEENAKIIADAILQKKVQGIENHEPRILVVKDLNYAQGDFPLLLINGLLENYEASISSQLKNNGVAMPTEPQPTPAAKPHREGFTLAAAGILSAIPSLISGGLSLAADVMRFFKGDYNVIGKEFSVDEEALIASVAGKIATSTQPTAPNGVENQKPTILVYNFNTILTSELISRVSKLLNQKLELDKSVANLKAKVAEAKAKGDAITKLQTEIEELNKKKTKTTDETEKENIQKNIDAKTQEKTSKTNALNALNKSLENVNKSVLDSETLLKSFDSFFSSITASTDNKPSMLVDAMLREHINAVHVSHLLHLKVCSKGGEAMTIKKPLSIGGGDTAYISGIVIAYVLAKTTGEVEAAGTCSELAHLNYKLGYKKDEDEKPTLNRIVSSTDPPPKNDSEPEKGGLLRWIKWKR
jgi:hypothetical protein